MEDYEVSLNGQWWPCSLERSVIDGIECYLWCVRAGREFVGYNAAALARLLSEGRARRVSPSPDPVTAALSCVRMSA